MGNIETRIIELIKLAVRKVSLEISNDVITDIYLEIPKEKKFGDFSVNIAMRLSKELKRNPFEIGNILIAGMKKIQKDVGLEDDIEDIKIEKPGFINFYLSNRGVIEALKEIICEPNNFGRLSIGKGKNVQIEFVSANPTGPLTVAHGRQAAIGDSLGRVLEFCGYKVIREYYINDEGVQIDTLGKSVKARLMEMAGKHADFPENGYKGEYVYEIAEKIKDDIGNKKIEDLPEDFFTGEACKYIMQTIIKDLEDFGVKFDVWYSQKTLFKSGNIEKALDILRSKGFLYEKDSATWFRSTEFGDDKDRVVIKNDGSYPYVTADIAYHKEKFEKGYDKIINIWGPDHHGYINRIKAVCQAMGYDKDRLFILIAQLVTLYRDGKPVRMSTREGQFVTLREVMDEVGRDAGRFFFIMRRTESHLDFDLELAKAKTMDNPVYYIQYAHARIVSVIKFSDNIKPDLEGLHLLNKPQEIDIIKILMQYPNIIEASMYNLEPYILLAYLQNLARLFHSYYDLYRIVTDDKPLTAARLVFAKAIKIVLASGLKLLGVDAPEKM